MLTEHNLCYIIGIVRTREQNKQTEKENKTMKRVEEIMGSNATVMVLVHSNDKYTSEGETKEVCYKDCVGFTVLDGKEGKQFTELAGGTDEHDEYLILNMKDGSRVQYNNSHVDLFIWGGVSVIVEGNLPRR